MDYSYINVDDFVIQAGQTLSFKRVNSYWRKNKTFTVRAQVGKGKHGFIYALENTSYVVKLIPINIYLLDDDCNSEDPEIMEDLDNCAHKTTESEFNLELKTSIKMGVENIGPKVIYYNIFDMKLVNEKRIEVGAFIMDRMQFTLQQYYDMIKNVNNFEVLWNQAKLLVINQKIKSFKLFDVYQPDLHLDNIMVLLRFIDFAKLGTFEEYVAHQTYLEFYLDGK